MDTTQIPLPIKKLTAEAVMPHAAYAGDAGIDLLLQYLMGMPVLFFHEVDPPLNMVCH